MWRKNPPNWAQEMQRKLPGENPPNCKQFRQVALRTDLYGMEKMGYLLIKISTCFTSVLNNWYLYIRWHSCLFGTWHLACTWQGVTSTETDHTVKLSFNEKSLNISIFVLRVWKNVKVPFTMYLHHVGWENFKTKAGPFQPILYEYSTSLQNISGDMKDYKKQK